MDTYRNFEELHSAEREGIDFCVTICNRKSAKLVVLAPHGGAIEPGTSELAIAVAGTDLHVALFEGIKTHNNSTLHLTSTNFDEPRCVEIAEKSNTVLTLHGERSVEEVVYIGGANFELRSAISKTLDQAGFTVREHRNPNLQGASPMNICNRGRSRKGVQLEFSRGLRQLLFRSLSSEGRTFQTSNFENFVAAIREGLSNGGTL